MSKLENCIEKDYSLLFPIKLKAGTLTKLTLREQTGYDEEELSQDMYKENPILFLDRLIYRCTVSTNVGELSMEDIHGIETPDKESMALEIRILSLGEKGTFQARCPACGVQSSITIDLRKDLNFSKPEKLAKEVDFELDVSFKKNWKKGEILEYKKGKVTVVTGADFQEYLEANFGEGKRFTTSAELKTLMLKKLVVWTGVAHQLSENDYRGMTRRVRQKLAEIIDKNRVGYDFMPSVTCKNTKCRASFPMILGPSSFFE